MSNIFKWKKADKKTFTKCEMNKLGTKYQVYVRKKMIFVQKGRAFVPNLHHNLHHEMIAFTQKGCLVPLGLWPDASD